jgi:hypothetical protein
VAAATRPVLPEVAVAVGAAALSRGVGLREESNGDMLKNQRQTAAAPEENVSSDTHQYSKGSNHSREPQHVPAIAVGSSLEGTSAARGPHDTPVHPKNNESRGMKGLSINTLTSTTGLQQRKQWQRSPCRRKYNGRKSKCRRHPTATSSNSANCNQRTSASYLAQQQWLQQLLQQLA